MNPFSITTLFSSPLLRKLAAVDNSMAKNSRIANAFSGIPIPDRVIPNSVPENFEYDIQYIPGNPQYNAKRNRSEQEAGYPLTQLEYNELFKRLAKPGMSKYDIDKQIQLATHKWLPGVDNNPKEILSPSSSVAQSVSIGPDNNIHIRLGKKTYTYRGGNDPISAAEEAMKLLNSGSIGHELNRYNSSSWGSTHRL